MVVVFGAQVDDAWFSVAGAAIEFEQCGRGHEVAEFGVAVVAGVEIRALLGDDVADVGQVGTAVVVGGCLEGIAQLGD